MPPLEPPTGEGPGTLAVRRMSGREPGRFIAFWNAFKASSCRPSCINRNPATSASRNVDGGGNACDLDCSGFDEDEDADDDCNLVTIGPLLLQMGCCCCCCGSILLLCVDVLVKAFVYAMMRRIVGNDFIVYILICSVEYSIVFIEMSSS